MISRLLLVCIFLHLAREVVNFKFTRGIRVRKINSGAGPLKDDTLDTDYTGFEIFGSSNTLQIGLGGTISSAVVAYSEYVLKTTGCGLPPGPYGLLGAAEGVSYTAVVGIFLWSVTKKIRTGSGLEAGQYGLLGAAEGLSFLVVTAGIAIGVLNLQNYGFLPGFLPNDQCFGIND
jgi:hypothetical protein